jgi:hypothetical protein
MLKPQPIVLNLGALRLSEEERKRLILMELVVVVQINAN